MSGVECVSEADLRAFLIGDLPERVAELVARHLDECPECETAARRLDDSTDPVIRSLRRAVGGETPNSWAGGDQPDGPVGSPPPTDAPPTGPPGYEILGELGRGGMSVVYRARQRHPRRLVALKMILAAVHAGAARKARFLAEADATARLQHPNIVSVYEVGECGGLPYFSLEYVAGGTLAEHLDGAPLPPPTAAALVETLARAVQYAHEMGVVHRDLKPANVLLRKSGDGRQGTDDGVTSGRPLSSALCPLISDFGLAKQADLALTATGDVLGTPQYMAPEQADGTKTVGPAADIYALGAILYECLTGRPPFRGASTLDTLELVRSSDPVAPRALQPGVPRDLETICLKCLEKEAACRYATAGNLANDLRRFLTGEPIDARPSGPWERGRKWVRRRPAAATSVALAAVLAIGALTAAALFKGQRDEARSARRDAVGKLRDSLIARARAGRTSGRPGRRFESLDALAEAFRLRQGPDLRDEVIACLTCMDIRRARQWAAPPADAQWVDFDDSFTRFVSVATDGTISIRRVADDVEEMQIPGRAEATWAVLSRDGRYLWVIGEPSGRREVWRLDTGARVLLSGNAPADRQRLHCFRPDGGRVAVVNPDGAIAQYELPSGQLVRSAPESNRIIAMEFDPTGRRLATVTNAGVCIRDAETGAKLNELPDSAGATESLAWHPSGELLAVTGSNGLITLWNVAKTRSSGLPHPVRILEGRRFGGVRLTFNHAGDLLAGTSWDGRLRVCDTATGRQVFSMPFTQNVVRFSADDRFLGGDRRDGQFVLWEVERGREYRTMMRDALRDWTFSYGQCAVSPDGRYVAAATDIDVGIWELATGRQRAVLPVGRSGVAAFDAAGAFISAGPDGPKRWPVSASADGSVRVGRPEPLPLPGVFSWVAGTPDGRVVAGVEIDKGVVVDRDRPDRPIWLTPLSDARDVAISPDGRWVVTGDHGGQGLTVWNADSGRVVKRLCDGHLGRSIFSPDCRFLAGGFSAIDGKMFMGRVWDVTTWREISAFVGMPLAFAPRGAMIAVETGQGEVRLLRPETAAVIARLENPGLERADFGCFTPDGAGLVLTSNDDPAVHVWNLRLIRSRLHVRGLDWDAEPFPSAKEDSANLRPQGIDR
jgi:serine/threonine protein kinase/WD40 repeat protein